METKKNESVRLENYSLLFFELGLAFTLLVVYLTLEHKTLEKSIKELGFIIQQEEIIEDIPIVQNLEQIKPPPPPPQAQALQVIEIVDNEVKINETILESTETDQFDAVEISDTEIEAIEEVVEEEEVVEDVPFAVIEDVPIYPGCDNGSKLQKKKCLEDKIAVFVGKNFDTELATELSMSPGKKKVFVQFNINHKGLISDIRVRGPHARLEKEAVRVVKMLPKMIPGKQRGRPVGVKYALPITLEVD